MHCVTAPSVLTVGSVKAGPPSHTSRPSLALLAGMLKLWIDGVQRAGVKNYMVIAIDDAVGSGPSCCELDTPWGRGVSIVAVCVCTV